MRVQKLLAALALAGLAWLQVLPARADVKPNALFSEGMVLQQGAKVPFWGTADEGEKVTIRFQGQEATATAKSGTWHLHLSNLKPGGPFELTIAGKNTIQLKNVLVGEVWLASGQSNMEFPLRASFEAEKTIANSANPQLRLFTVTKNPSLEPLKEVKGSWAVSGPATVPNFSAVAYYFGRDLQKALNVPVGVIHSSWGGTRAEAWTSRRVLEAMSDYKGEYEKLPKDVENFPKVLEKYKAALEAHKQAVAKAKAEGKTPPVAPRAPLEPGKNPNTASALYNGMISPLLPYALKGAIWYQGESNAGGYAKYDALMTALINNWRHDFQNPDLAFFSTQLAPFMAIEKEPSDTAWARQREAQLQTSLKVPRSGMAVITDVGEEKDIHPKRKEPVGHRLALAALGIAYEQKITYSGPRYEGLKVEENKAVLSFKHVGKGLEAKGGPLQGFTVAGEDKKFHNAQAVIQDDKVIVTCPQVARPVAVRYGWANYPVVNLWNKDGLPASPFRTDSWALAAPK